MLKRNFLSLSAILSNAFDVVFLCDGSSYITYSVFKRTLLLAKSILSSYNISKEQTNVAAVVYASDVIVSFNLTQHYTFSAISTAIDGIPYLNQTSLNISAALATVNDTIFTTDRRNVLRVCVVFVSGKLSGDFTQISQGLRDQGIIIIAIGVGSGYSLDQLNSLASQPSATYVIDISLVLHIDTMEEVIAGAIAGGNLRKYFV